MCHVFLILVLILKKKNPIITACMRPALKSGWNQEKPSRRDAVTSRKDATHAGLKPPAHQTLCHLNDGALLWRGRKTNIPPCQRQELEHVKASGREKGAEISVATQVSRCHNCWSEPEPINTRVCVCTAQSSELGINANYTLSYRRRMPNMSGFSIPCERPI